MSLAVGAAQEAAPPANAVTVFAFAAGVFLLLTYSQAWEVPLVGEKADPSSSGLIRSLYLPAYAVGLVLLATSPWTALRAMIRQPALLALLAIVAASMLWSVSPDQTGRRILANYCTTLGGVVLAARWRWASLAELIATAFAILMVLSVLAGLFAPSLGRMLDIFPGAWRGVWPEKNTFGGLMAFGFVTSCASALLNPRRAVLWWGFAVLAVGLVLLSTSKTSLLTVALGAAALAFIGLVRRGPATGVAATWAAVVGVMLLAGFIVFASDAVFGLLGKDATLTGRTRIWAAAMRQIQERPWLGYGYGAVWDEEGRWGPLAWITKDAGFRAHHAHNAWLEQWLGLGIPGLLAWAGFFTQTFVTALIAVYREKGAYLAFPFIAAYALITLTESIAVTYNDMRWVIFVALAVKLAFPDRKQIR